MVKKYIEEKNFAGIKLYPPLGYFPFDKRLDLVFSYAEQNGIPVTTHCARGGIYYKGTIKDRIHPITGVEIKAHKNKFFTDAYTDPDNYNYLLHKFPDLKINLAHFGGFDEWQKYLQNTLVDEDGETNWLVKIRQLMRLYPNVYTDISYTLFDAALIPLLKSILREDQLKDRVLFGSDYYMVQQEESEREFYINLSTGLDENEFKLIAQSNATQFLFGK